MCDDNAGSSGDDNPPLQTKRQSFFVQQHKRAQATQQKPSRLRRVLRHFDVERLVHAALHIRELDLEPNRSRCLGHGDPVAQALRVDDDAVHVDEVGGDLCRCRVAGNWRRLASASYGGFVSRTRTKPAKPDASSAGRIATSRRADRGARADPPAKRVAPSGGRGKKGKATSSPAARFFKLIVLLGFMACLGFGIVLVLDVGMTLIGGIHLGQITFAELVDKVHDRVFDKDVPEPAKKRTEAKKPTAKKPASNTSSAPVAADRADAPEPRAELPAPAPSEYAKEAAPRQDVEVVEARERLDRLLKGL